MSKQLFYPLLAIMLLVAAILACGESAEPQKVGEETKAVEQEAAPTPQFFAEGDIVQVGDYTIVLNECTLVGGALKATFTIENQGDEDLHISSFLEFTARDAEGLNLDTSFECSPSLSGTVIPGDKIKGKVCWGPASLPARIYYEPGLFSSTTVVWEVTE